MLKNVTPNLMVKDVRAAIHFYTEVLGFTLVMAVPDGSHDIVTSLNDDRALTFAMVRHGSVEIMLHESLYEEFPEFEGKKTGGTFTLYIVVEEIENFYENVKANKNISLVKELHTPWYGMKEFYIKDPDGYILGFAERKT